MASVWNPVQPGRRPAEMLRGVVERLLAGIGAIPGSLHVDARGLER